MAEAKKTAVTVTKPTEVEMVQLTLSKDEAEWLGYVLYAGMAGDAFWHGHKAEKTEETGIGNAIHRALNAAGVNTTANLKYRIVSTGQIDFR